MVSFMARRCGVSGKGVLSGNNVSHAHNKTRRRFLPNMQNVSFTSDLLDRRVRLRLAVNGIRTIEKNGGLDVFLLNTPSNRLGPKEQTLKRMLVRKQAEAKKTQDVASVSGESC
jgi:large subunit ribosomal protein L28